VENNFPLLYFGPMNYYKSILSSNDPTWRVSEKFVKQTLRNRCTVYAANGPVHLTIPVKRVHGATILLSDALIDYSESWQQIHWRTIKSAYGRTPFFEHFEYHFVELYEQKHTKLVDFLLAANDIVFRIFKLKAPEINGNPSTRNLQILLDQRSHVRDYLDHKYYYQIFSGKHGFTPGLSVLDYIFHCGNKLS